MPRNAAGTYALPAGHPVTTGTTISSTLQNTTTSDIATALTDSLDRNGNGAMLAPLELPNGTVALPAVTFDSDPDTGLYRVGANNPAMAVNGALAQSWATTGSTFPQGVTVTQSQTNTWGVVATGNGSAEGVLATGGTTGAGGTFSGGSSSGAGVQGAGTGGGAGVIGQGQGAGAGGSFVGGTTGYGVIAQSDTSSPVRAALRIVPQDAEPTGANQVGDIYVTTAGVLKICTVAGTPGTWVSVGAQ